MVEHVRYILANERVHDDTAFNNVYKKMLVMAKIASLPSIEPPRRCGLQTQRNNVDSDSSQQYFKRAVFLPFLDSLNQQLEMRFNSLSIQAVRALALLPLNTDSLHADCDTIDNIFDHYKVDLPSPNTFKQEIMLWRQTWANEAKPALPLTISSALCHANTCDLMFPNVTTILKLLLLTPVTSSGVERANSSLRRIKDCFRSTMGEDRFNSLILLYVHKDIELNNDQIIDNFARKHPRRMLFLNPLGDRS